MSDTNQEWKTAEEMEEFKKTDAGKEYMSLQKNPEALLFHGGMVVCINDEAVVKEAKKVNIFDRLDAPHPNTDGGDTLIKVTKTIINHDGMSTYDMWVFIKFQGYDAPEDNGYSYYRIIDYKNNKVGMDSLINYLANCLSLDFNTIEHFDMA